MLNDGTGFKKIYLAMVQIYAGELMVWQILSDFICLRQIIRLTSK